MSLQRISHRVYSPYTDKQRQVIVVIMNVRAAIFYIMHNDIIQSIRSYLQLPIIEVQYTIGLQIAQYSECPAVFQVA